MTIIPCMEWGHTLRAQLGAEPTVSNESRIEWCAGSFCGMTICVSPSMKAIETKEN